MSSLINYSIQIITAPIAITNPTSPIPIMLMDPEEVC
jgi:hypothetical protein